MRLSYYKAGQQETSFRTETEIIQGYRSGAYQVHGHIIKILYHTLLSLHTAWLGLLLPQLGTPDFVDSPWELHREKEDDYYWSYRRDQGTPTGSFRCQPKATLPSGQRLASESSPHVIGSLLCPLQNKREIWSNVA